MKMDFSAESRKEFGKVDGGVRVLTYNPLDVSFEVRIV